MNEPGAAGAAAYDQIVEFYELEHAGFDDDIDLYRNLAVVVGDPILELGCGSGRILLPLAEEGFHVTGVDGSAAMLARAAQKVGQTGVADRVTLHRADMRAVDDVPGGPFGLVILGLNAFLHLTTQAAQRSLLESVHRALDPRGQLVIDVLNPTPDQLHELGHGVTHEGGWVHPEGGTVDKWSSRHLVASEQLLETTIWYDHQQSDGVVRRARSEFSMRYVYFSELALMLETAGFAEWRAYGGYELDPYDDAAERLIVTAEVTPSPSDAV